MTNKITEQEAVQKINDLVARAVSLGMGVERRTTPYLGDAAVFLQGHVRMSLSVVGRNRRTMTYRVRVEGGRKLYDPSGFRAVNMSFEKALAEYISRINSTFEVDKQDAEMKARVLDMRATLTELFEEKGYTKVDHDFMVKAGNFNVSKVGMTSGIVTAQTEQNRYIINFMLVDGELKVTASKKVWLDKNFPDADDVVGGLL